jgi:hypothetical protein
VRWSKTLVSDAYDADPVCHGVVPHGEAILFVCLKKTILFNLAESVF